jgi:nitrate/nitrite transport system ATP-binding protein
VVFQNYALLPWLTALGTSPSRCVALAGLERRRRSREHSHRSTSRWSGSGREHKQAGAAVRRHEAARVGIARAFAIQPKMLLLDEPFGALDALTRGTIQDELLKICEATHQTVFMITHDVDEAILLADRILLMTNGPHARIAEPPGRLPRPAVRGAGRRPGRGDRRTGVDRLPGRGQPGQGGGGSRRRRRHCPQCTCAVNPPRTRRRER